MLSTEECIEILNHDVLELSEGVTLDCNMNILEIPSRELNIALNESQKRLLICLVKKVCTKRDIIYVVWYENHQRISDNNYHQLTFQLRALLQRNNLPANLLVTVPYYGLKLNESQWKMLTRKPIADSVAAKPEFKPEGQSPAVAVKKVADTAAFSMAETMRLPSISASVLSQNAFILCLFVALIVFI